MMHPRQPVVPDRPTFDAMANFLKANLVKTAAFSSGERFTALSETEVRFNESSWFWTDDNAKAAELLSEPALYDRDPATADAALDFVIRMSQGAVIQRRGGPAELRILNADPAAFRVETAFFIVEGDLTRGLVRHALRFNDGRTLTAAHHTGNHVAIRRRFGTTTIDVEDTITGSGVEPGGREVALWFTSTLRHPRSVLQPRPAVLGELTFRYVVSADRPSMALTVTLTVAPGTVLRDVVVTTALDQLRDVPGVGYRAVGLRAGGQDRSIRGVPDSRVVLHRGSAEYAVVLQEGETPGFAYAIHTLFRDGGKLGEMVAVGQHKGRLQAVRNRYALGKVSAAAQVVIREERMLTGGGYYDEFGHYAQVMAEALGGGDADPSMTYDIGAELNAVAVHLLFARTGRYATPPAPERLEAMRSWYDRHVDRYFAAIRPEESDALIRVFARGIAFVVLSLDCMLRATGSPRYRALLATGVRLILGLARRAACGYETHDITFGDIWAGGTPFLDCHASCILALSRAAWHGDADGAIGRVIHEAILGIRLYTGTVHLHPGHEEPYDGIAVCDPPPRFHADTGHWNFKVGLVLRALHAARHAASAGVIAATARDAWRLDLRLDLAEELIGQSLRRRDDTLELLTARRAGETNSETQPWGALGLVPIVDELIVACPVPSPAMV